MSEASKWNGKVHYRADGVAAAAPCGYVFEPHLLKLDWSSSWDDAVPYPVTCLDCKLFHSPPRWKVKRWRAQEKKQKV